MPNAGGSTIPVGPVEPLVPEVPLVPDLLSGLNFLLT